MLLLFWEFACGHINGLIWFRPLNMTVVFCTAHSYNLFPCNLGFVAFVTHSIGSLIHIFPAHFVLSQALDKYLLTGLFDSFFTILHIIITPKLLGSCPVVHTAVTICYSHCQL